MCFHTGQVFVSLFQIKWGIAVPGWLQAGNSCKHLSSELRIWWGFLRQHQWTGQKLHQTAAGERYEVRGQIRVQPKRETAVKASARLGLLGGPSFSQFSLSFYVLKLFFCIYSTLLCVCFLCRKRLKIQDALNHPWIKVTTWIKSETCTVESMFIYFYVAFVKWMLHTAIITSVELYSAVVYWMNWPQVLHTSLRHICQENLL